MSTSWSLFKSRVENRAIRVLDLVSILVLDALVLVVGYLLIIGVEKLAGAKSQFFQLASQLSHGLFLLLYVVLVYFDVRDFLIEGQSPYGNAETKVSARVVGR